MVGHDRATVTPAMHLAPCARASTPFRRCRAIQQPTNGGRGPRLPFSAAGDIVHAMTKRPHILLQGLTLVLTLALVMVGFGHHPPSGEEFARAQYEQVFGADLCQDSAEEDGHQDRSCPLCHIISAYTLPAPGGEVSLPAFAMRDPGWSQARQVPVLALHANRPPQRGPPLA